MAQVTKEIISPVFITESGESYIALDGKAFLVGENTITEAEITSAPGEFRSLVLALNNFTLTNEGLTWFNGINRIRFNRESNNFFVNNSEVLAESLTNHLLASGIVNYTNKAKIQLFEYAAKNINNFVSLDFAQKIEEGNVKCYVMKLNEDFYVYRINEANKIYKFGKLDANAAFDYVKEQTGYEITDMTQELLEGARKEAAEKLERINLLEQMIAFLKDQRGVIAEADKSIQEIKEADTLINSEIKRLEEEVEAIKNGTEKVDEGCGKCGEDSCICATESEETETDATAEETTNEEAGDEAGIEAEDIKADHTEIDNDEKRQAKGEEATDAAPSDEGEDGAKEVVKEDKKSFEELLQVAEDAAADIEAELNDLSEPKKAEEDQEELEASYDEAEEKGNEESLTEWAVRGMDAIYDDGIPEELRAKAKKLGVRMTYDDDASPYAGALSLSSKNKAAILKIAAITGHLDQIKDGTYEIEESTQATNEAEVEEELVTRQDGYVPGVLKFKTEEYAEGTEVQIDAEAYTTSGQDESITVFADEKPIKVTKRDVELADGETV